MAQKLFSGPGDPVTKTASEALTANRLVKINSSDPAKVDQCDTAGEAVIGCVEAAYNADALVAVRTAGTRYVEAGAALSAGDWVTTDASGRAVAVSLSTDSPAGRAMTAAAQAGDRIAVLIDPQRSRSDS